MTRISRKLSGVLSEYSLSLFQCFRMSDRELLALDGVESAIVEEIRTLQMGESLTGTRIA